MPQFPNANKLRDAFDCLISCEALPPEEAWFALGKELQDAHLGALIDEVLKGKQIAVSTLRGLLDAATRIHDTHLTPEVHDRVNDEGHARRLLAEIRQYERWPEIRDELVKFSKRTYAELPDPVRTLAAPPVDNSAFRPAKELLSPEFPTYKAQHRALEKNPQIRWQRPTSKKGKPIANRLEIHAGDWNEFLNQRAQANPNPLDLPAEVVDAAVQEVERRKRQTRR
jgi:hypothetical protein